jgi:hypothetical protein
VVSFLQASETCFYTLLHYYTSAHLLCPLFKRCVRNSMERLLPPLSLCLFRRLVTQVKCLGSYTRSNTTSGWLLSRNIPNCMNNFFENKYIVNKGMACNICCVLTDVLKLPQSGQPVSGLRSEPGTFRIRTRRAEHSREHI